MQKTIHYIWLSENNVPSLGRRCIKSWHKCLPQYKVVKWNKLRIEEISKKCELENPLKIDYVREAICQNKWAFASDYLRLWIVYHFGGIYLDTDIALKPCAQKFIEDNINNNFTSFLELQYGSQHLWASLIDEQGNPKTKDHVPGFAIQAAFIMGKPNNEFCKLCLSYYKDAHFDFQKIQQNPVLAPDVLANCARDFGFKYIDKNQILNNNAGMIFNSKYVSASYEQIAEDNIAHHLCMQSWNNQNDTFYNDNKLVLNKVYRRIKKLPKVF